MRLLIDTNVFLEIILALGSGMTIDLFIDRPILSTHQSQNVTFMFSQLRKYEKGNSRRQILGFDVRRLEVN